MEPQRRRPQKSSNRLFELYEAILWYAHGNRYLMRAPIRLWYQLGWEARHPGEDNHKNSGTTSSRRKSSEKLHIHLKTLEDRGYIRRFPGGIEIMENI